MPLDYSKSFIETQFPVSRVSKESYKERKANLGQTLTGLGKWWGRKPLIMVRATTIGALLPVSDDPVKDREIFLKIMTMDDDGLKLRRDKSIPANILIENATSAENTRYFDPDSGKLKKNISKAERTEITDRIFDRLSYDEKLRFCLRPEQIDGPDKAAWDEINAHLETNAYSLQELTEQLGQKRFGHTPIVGDCFCGGGSNVFEPARLGCDVVASDLNPVAGLLTWAALNIAGASDEEINKLREFQQTVYDKVDKQILDWGIEVNESGDRANSYLYCVETTCPECGYKVPLAPSWVIGKGTKTVAILTKNEKKGFDIDIKSDASKANMKQAESGTVNGGQLVCPHCDMATSISGIRGDGNGSYGLRQWEKHEFTPRKDDIFTERLYCIKYERPDGTRYYVTPTSEDLAREQKVVDLLSEVLADWQEKGFIPSDRIEEGDKTTELIRTRGWRYWHQLFNPRQLLMVGNINRTSDRMALSRFEISAAILGINSICNFNSKLSRWNSGSGVEKVVDVFYNQALNTLLNYGCRGIYDTINLWFLSDKKRIKITSKKMVSIMDAHNFTDRFDIIISDPPYSDAVNYHELAEFFLAWDKSLLGKAFPEWYTDSKRALAVKGVGESFNKSMVAIYKNLTQHMPDDGMQIVMFTHQDTKVWAELSMILWAAGLQVTAAWCIATETDAVGIKQGNYVKGTVLMVLRKRTNTDMVFMDELYEEIRDEVKHQIDSMRDLDDKADPDFNDGDYLLAAYVAALKALTSYGDIEGLNIEYELSKARESSEESPVTKIINTAKREAYDYLVPEGIDSFIWRELSVDERFYIKGFEMELNGVNKMSAYQELARGFGVKDYTPMLGSIRANEVRMKTPSEYKNRNATGDGFDSSVLRHVLLAIYLAVKEENSFEGRNYLRSKYLDNNEYWALRTKLVTMLSFLSQAVGNDNMMHWQKDAEYAGLLKEAVKNDSV